MAWLRLKAALNLAFRDGRVASDTEWSRVSAFKNVASNRKLFLSDKQVKTLLQNIKGGFHRLVKAGVLTGARYGELGGAKVKDFDPRDGTLELTGKTGHRICYLSDEAVKFFKDVCKDRLPEANILVKDDGNPWGKSHHLRSMKEAVVKAKLPRDCVFYSLRHYHISKALLSGMPMQVVAENTGTSVRMIEKHYGKFTRKDRRQMMNEVVLG
jgi:integrase